MGAAFPSNGAHMQEATDDPIILRPFSIHPHERHAADGSYCEDIHMFGICRCNILLYTLPVYKQPRSPRPLQQQYQQQYQQQQDQVHATSAAASAPYTLDLASLSPECGICTFSDDESKAQMWQRLPCLHEFHMACLAQWITSHDKTTCPTCREDAWQHLPSSLHFRDVRKYDKSKQDKSKQDKSKQEVKHV